MPVSHTTSLLTLLAVLILIRRSMPLDGPGPLRFHAPLRNGFRRRRGPILLSLPEIPKFSSQLLKAHAATSVFVQRAQHGAGAASHEKANRRPARARDESAQIVSPRPTAAPPCRHDQRRGIETLPLDAQWKDDGPTTRLCLCSPAGRQTTQRSALRWACPAADRPCNGPGLCCLDLHTKRAITLTTTSTMAKRLQHVSLRLDLSARVPTPCRLYGMPVTRRKASLRYYTLHRKEPSTRRSGSPQWRHR